MGTGKALLLAEVRERVRSGEARELRIAAHLSLNDVAEDVGVCPAALWAWEQGRYRPRGERAVRYAHLMRELASR